MIELDSTGAIVPDQTTVLIKYNVRFPTAKEQKAGMTEVSRQNRLKKKAKRGK